MSTISRHLVAGGHFIATLGDSNALVRTIRNRSHKENESFVWRVALLLPAQLQNKICCVEMDSANMERMSKADKEPFGITYRFTLEVGDGHRNEA